MTEASTGAHVAPNVHNGTYTISNPERGHFTLKLYTVRKGDLAGKRILAILVGPDNTSNYSGRAFWNDAEKVAYVWKRFKGPKDLRIDGYHWTHEDHATSEDGVGLSATQKKLAIWADLVLRAYDFTGDGLALLPQPDDLSAAVARKHDERGMWLDGVRQRTSYWYGEGYRLDLAGHCSVCNRKLTDPTSIARGIGPVCEGRSGKPLTAAEISTNDPETVERLRGGRS